METVIGLGVGAVLVDLAIRLVALVVVPRDRLPTAAMAWLLAIFFIPVVGLPLYLAIGNPTLPKARRQKQLEMDEVVEKVAGECAVGQPERPPDWIDPIVAMNRKLTAMPMVGGNAADLIDDYAGSLAAMAGAVDEAVSFVHVEFYILSLDSTTGGLFDSLERAHERGVTVRVLLDHWASSHCRDYDATITRLSSMGVRWQLMLPVQPLRGRYQRIDLRNHRKLLVVDGAVAFIGSQNVIDRSYNKKRNLARGLEWQELMCRVEGPVVTFLDLVFATDWYLETGERLPAASPESNVLAGDLGCQAVPSGPGYPVENNLQLFLSMLYSAREQVIITSPYFVPEDSILRALLAATARGVHVELFVSAIGDQALVWHAQRSYYQALLDRGVQIYFYPAPFILHAKHFSVDDDLALIGSSNMDMRSFGLNSEISLLVQSREFVADLRAVERRYREVSHQLTADEWHGEPMRATVLDGLARLTAALQ